MNLNTDDTTNQVVTQKLAHAGDCLYRSSVTDIYYAILKRDGKQIKRSLKTTDKAQARDRLQVLRRKVERLTTGDGSTLHFAEYDTQHVLTGGLAKRWIDYSAANLKPSSRLRREMAIKALSPFFKTKTIRGLKDSDFENWVKARGQDTAARTFNIERETLILILDYAVKHGVLLENPAKPIKRRTQGKKAVLIPEQEQFTALLTEMRAGQGVFAADLVEFLAYSGMRIDEATGLNGGGNGILWGDVNFNRKNYTVRGSDVGTKNHKARTVPLFPPLEKFLIKMRDALPIQPKPTDPIFQIKSARKSIATACKSLNYPNFGHHTFRHFFCSNAIEKSIDFKVIAEWLGHSDGGVLVAKTYGHLRNTHSDAMALKMTFEAGPTTSTPTTATQTPMPTDSHG